MVILITGPVGAHFDGRAAYRAVRVESQIDVEDDLLDDLGGGSSHLGMRQSS